MLLLLGNIDISEHCVFNLTDNKPGEQYESYKSHQMEPRVDKRVAIKHRNLIKHVVMAQGEEPRKRLQRCVHTHHWEGGTCHRETEHTPQGTDTH